MNKQGEPTDRTKDGQWTKPRVYPLDGARGIAIIAVVFGHVWRGMERSGLIERGHVFDFVDGMIYIWHMPLFFFVSGILFQPSRSVGSGLCLRAVTLLPAMILWCWIDAALRYGAGGNANDTVGAWQQVVMSPFPPHGVYWFLLALFLVQSISEILGQLFPAKWRNLVLITAGALAMILFPLGKGTVFEATLHNFPFFVSGALLGGRSLTVASWKFSPGVLVLAVMVGGGALALGKPIIPLENLVVVTLGVAGSFLFVRLVASMRESAFVAYLGRNTLPIYLTHVIFIAILRTILLRFGVDEPVVLVCLLTILGCALPLVLAAGLRRVKLSRFALLDPPRLPGARQERGK